MSCGAGYFIKDLPSLYRFPVSGKKLTLTSESSLLQEQISCFGGLKVIGTEGKEVSLKFLPRIKQLFVLIFLHSVTGRNGISSKKITDQKGKLNSMLEMRRQTVMFGKKGSPQAEAFV